jgi:hypothetical protein
MKAIGFSINKINIEKLEKLENLAINNQITFNSFEKEKSDLLKSGELFKLGFSYVLHYQDLEKNKGRKPEVSFEGFLVISLEKEESKEFQKSWKKKQIPQGATIPLYNLILKRCTVRALQLEEDVGLPTHINLPQISSKKPDQ